MKDIELPPLPHGDIKYFITDSTMRRMECDAHSGRQLKSYARAAVEADRAQRVPEKYDDTLMPFMALMRRELHANSGKGDRPGWRSMSPEVALLEIYWHTAKLSAAVKNNDGPAIEEHSADVANMAMMLLDVCDGLTPVVVPSSTPAQPAQASGWSEEFGLVLEAANRVELECYEQGSAECMAAVQQILDGQDRGEGVANEPWESIRRRLIALVAPAQPAQQEPRPFNAATLAQIAAVRPDLIPQMHGILAPAAQHQEPPRHQGVTTMLSEEERKKLVADEMELYSVGEYAYYTEAKERLEAFARAIESAACAERDARIAELEQQLTEVMKDAERLDYIQKNARNDPKMDGNHAWWPTTFNKALKGPTIRAAIDAAIKEQTS